MGPKEDNDDQRTGQSVLWGKTEGVRSFLSGEEKAQSRPHQSFPVLKGQLQRGQRLCLHNLPYGEDKRQWLQVASIIFIKNSVFFYSEKNQSLEQPPQGHDGSSHHWKFSTHR